VTNTTTTKLSPYTTTELNQADIDALGADNVAKNVVTKVVTIEEGKEVVNYNMVPKEAPKVSYPYSTTELTQEE
jgi:hypothetical protein